MGDSVRTALELPARQAAIRARCYHPSSDFVEFGRSDLDQSIVARFEQQVGKYPNRVAVKTKCGHLTYSTLNQMANHLAQAILAEQGHTTGPIALLLSRDISMIAAIMAVWKAGQICVTIDPLFPRARIRYVLEDSQASLIVSDGEHWSLAEELAEDAISLIGIDEGLSQVAAENLELPVAPDAVAYIMYTSGSTGQPKGVVHNHRNLLHNTMNYTNNFHICAEDRLTLLHSYSFNSAMVDIFCALLNGATVYPWQVKNEGISGLSEWLIREGITICSWSPTPFRLFAETLTERDKFPRLRIVALGSEPVSNRDVDLIRQHLSSACILVNRLGTTETNNFRLYFLDKDTPLDTGILPVGYQVTDKHVLLLDESGQEVGIHQVGEIAVRSPYLALGYWRKPELTKAAFLPDPAGRNERVYLTGDLGILRPDGCLEYRGRKDCQVKVRGYRVEVSEIEKALIELDGVKEAVVVARDDDDGEKRLVAYYVPSGEPTYTVGELRDALCRTLPDYMIPLAFVSLGALPLTPTGKMDRRALPEPSPTGLELGLSYTAPCTPVEEVLAGIWAQVLRVERVGIHDDFFALGGHSLHAAQVMSRLRDAFEIELPLRSLFDRPTVAGLAELIDSHRGFAIAVSAIRPCSRESALPLSFAQEPMWFIDQLEPGNPAYNIGMAFRLSGSLYVAALRQNLNAIVERHESLRTNFAVENGQPIQVVRPTLELALPITDLEGLPEARQEAEVRQLINREAGQPFDLARDPLVRARLFRLGEEEHVLSLCTHHLVNDGRSSSVLFGELSTLYEAGIRGESGSLPELPIQYPDYAVWQRQWLEEGILESQLCYWRQQLSGSPPGLELSTDRPRPAIQTYRGARRFLKIPKDLYDALKALGQREGATLFMTLLAAFNVLLYRYTGQEDIVVGSPIANRNRPEIEGLIGLFLNMLAFRTDLSGNPSFGELLGRVREESLAAFGNLDLPFKTLVEALQPPRDASRSPLFQVILEVSPMETLELSGLCVTALELDNGSAQFDLSLRLREGVDGLEGHFEYNTDLFDAATIDRLAGHFETLLGGIVRDPGRRISELPLLTEAERQQLLVEWNESRADYGPEKLLQELFEAQVERAPESVAVVFEGEELTYQAFNRRANQVAHHLRRLGVGPETLVGVYMERSVEMVVALYGVLKAGGAYVPLDPEYPGERVAFMVQDAQVGVLLTQERLVSSLPSHGAAVVCLDSEWETLAEEDDSNPASGVRPDNLAYVIYTSGSTGEPKAVMNTHRGIVNRLQWMQERYGLTAGDRVLQKTPYSFDVSVWEFFWPLMVGARLVVARPGGHRDSGYLVRQIVEQGITTVHFVPSMLQLFLEEKGVEGCRSLKRVICSGEALPYALQERFFGRLGGELHNLYGPTEAAVDVTHWECQRGSALGVVPIGRPLANTRLYVLDGYLQPVPIGVSGELYIGGVQVARGYLNRAGLTAEKFIPDPFSGDGNERLYRTGDLARYLADGSIEFMGRVDFQVKVRGFRIELGEIEAVLRGQAGVREVVVVAREDVPGDRRLVAYVVMGDGSGVGPREMREYLRAKLPDYMVPAAFVVVDELPLTANGKVDRGRLPVPGWEGQSQVAYVAPEEGLEREIAGIWQELLRVEKVGIDDSFFELGGHSLLLVRVHQRVSELTERELSITDLFRYPTIRRLAGYLSEGVSDGKQDTVEQSVDRAQARREALSRRQRGRQRGRTGITDERF